MLLGVNVILFVLGFNKTPQNFSRGGAHAKGTTVVPICPLSAPADLEIANSSPVARGLFGSAGERHLATETAGQRTARVAITSASLAQLVFLFASTTVLGCTERHRKKGVSVSNKATASFG